MDIQPRDWRESLAAACGGATLVLTDPPYGTTRNKWEMTLEPTEFYRLAFAATGGGAVVCTTAEPFTSHMVVGAGKAFKYAKRQPMRRIEPIVVAYKRAVKYNPQMTADPKGHRKWHRTNRATGSYNPYKEHTYESKGQKYPTTVLEVYQSPASKVHPTEKPVELMEYLIRTYTDEGDLVVDPFCGSGSTAVACKRLGRRFLGGDISSEYVAQAVARAASGGGAISV
tara:strand:+ start:1944 stop:2624 length:681 start_codon:yes stop_codon:yes gene_type:complete